MHFLKSTLLLLSSLFCLSASATDKIDMKFNLKKGDSYRVTIPMNAPMQITIKPDAEGLKELMLQMGVDKDSVDTKVKRQIEEMASSEEANKDMTVKMNMEMSLLFKVIEASSNKYKLEAWYEYLESSVDAEDEHVVLSTRKKPEGLSEDQQDELNKLKSIIGKKFYIEVDGKGKFLSLNGYDKIQKSVKLKKSSNPMGGDNSMLMEQLQESEIKTTMSSIFDVLPENEVAVGSSWMREYKIKDDMVPYTIKTKYTLKEIRKDDVLISSESLFYNNLGDNRMMSLDGMGTGNIELKKSDFLQQAQPYDYELNIGMKLFGMNMLMKSHVKGTYKVEKL